MGERARDGISQLPASETGAAGEVVGEGVGAVGWRERVDSVGPTVLVLGGFLTAPPMYRFMVRRMLERGAAGAVVGNVWTPDWLLAGVRGVGPITTRSARAFVDAVRLSRRVSGGAPLLVVGHSAGGFVARLLTAEEPFPGRRFGWSEYVGAIVTLGTPHRLTNGRGIGRRLNQLLAVVTDSAVAGAFYAPRIHYLSVASRAVVANPAGDGRQRVANLLYRSVAGRAAVPGTEGDGLVPVTATQLPGARHLVLDDFIHGPGASRAWYGSAAALDLWWPVALEEWRAALRVRAAAGSEAGSRAGSGAGPKTESAPGRGSV